MGALSSPTGSPASGAHPLHREHRNKQLSTETNKTALNIEFFLMKASEDIQQETAESSKTSPHPACYHECQRLSMEYKKGLPSLCGSHNQGKDKVQG